MTNAENPGRRLSFPRKKNTSKEIGAPPVDRFVDARAKLASFIGGEWVPLEDNFAAIKNRLRIAQTVRQRIVMDFSRGVHPTIPLGIVTPVQLLENDDLTCTGMNIDTMILMVTILRAAITRNGKSTDAINGANTIFNDYFRSAWKSHYPERTDPGDDDAT